MTVLSSANAASRSQQTRLPAPGGRVPVASSSRSTEPSSSCSDRVSWVTSTVSSRPDGLTASATSSSSTFVTDNRPSHRPDRTGEPSSPSPMLRCIRVGSGWAVWNEPEATVPVSARPSTRPSPASSTSHASPSGSRTWAQTSLPSPDTAADPWSGYSWSSSSRYSAADACGTSQPPQHACRISQRMSPAGSTARTACSPANTAKTPCGDRVAVPKSRGHGAGSAPRGPRREPAPPVRCRRAARAARAPGQERRRRTGAAARRGWRGDGRRSRTHLTVRPAAG